MAAANSPCGPPNCSSMRLASIGFGSDTRTVYISRLLCMNMGNFSWRLGHLHRRPPIQPEQLLVVPGAAIFLQSASRKRGLLPVSNRGRPPGGLRGAVRFRRSHRHSALAQGIDDIGEPHRLSYYRLLGKPRLAIHKIVQTRDESIRNACGIERVSHGKRKAVIDARVEKRGIDRHLLNDSQCRRYTWD